MEDDVIYDEPNDENFLIQAIRDFRNLYHNFMGYYVVNKKYIKPQKNSLSTTKKIDKN